MSKKIIDTIIQEIVNGEKKLVAETTSSVDGSFNVKLEPGIYLVQVEAEGFETYYEEIEITGNDEVNLEFAIDKDVTPPMKVTDLRACVLNPTCVKLQWDYSSELDLDYYIINRNEDVSAKVPVKVFLDNDKSYLDEELETETEYRYQVSAVDIAGNQGDKSDIEKIRTPDITPPEKLTLIAKLKSPTEIILNWSPSIAPDIDHYNIFRDKEKISETIETTYFDKGLVTETTYSYKVSAIDNAGNEGELSDAFLITTPDITPPKKVEGLEATLAPPYEIHVNWLKNIESDLSHYIVYRNNAYFCKVKGTKIRDVKIVNKTNYSYEVSAVDTSLNEGEKSESVNILALDTFPPGIVKNVNLEIRQYRYRLMVLLHWDNNREYDLSGYKIYRNNKLLVTERTPYFNDTEIDAWKTYSYQISAIDKQGNEGRKSKKITVKPGILGNKRTKEFHLSNCWCTRFMKNENKVRFRNIETPINNGFNGCYWCLKRFDTG